MRRTLVVEPVDAVDARAFVVASQQEEVLGVFDFVREQQTDRLKRLLPTIDVVAEKQVVGVGRKAAIFKKTQQVVVLPVDVTCSGSR